MIRVSDATATLSTIVSGVTSLTNVTDVYIDSSAGNDTTGTGAVGAPLRTHREFARRLNLGSSAFVGARARVTWSMNVNLVNNLPSSDPIEHVAILDQVTLKYINSGTLTQLASGTITAMTLVQSGPDTAAALTDTGLGGTTWTTVGMVKRIRNTTAGARLNTLAWTAKDLGSNQCRISNPTSVSGTGSSWQVGDTYVVEDVRKVYLGDLDIGLTGGAATALSTIQFQDVEIASFNAAGIACPRNASQLSFIGCKVSSALTFVIGNNAQDVFFACCLAGQTRSFGGLHFFKGCLFTGFYAAFGGLTSISRDTLFQGVGLLVGSGSVVLGDCGFFDATITTSNTTGSGISGGGSSLFAGSGGSLAIETQVTAGGGHLVYGSGNAGYGIDWRGLGGSIGYQTTLPTVTGTLGDFSLGGATQARAFDETALAGIGQQTALINTASGGWTNMAATIAGGGFAGNARNYEKNVSFCKR